MDGHHVGNALRDTWNTRPGSSVTSYTVVNDVPVFNNSDNGTPANADVINTFFSYVVSKGNNN